MKKGLIFTIIILLISCVNHSERKNSRIKIESFSFSKCLDTCDITSRIIKQNLISNKYHITVGAHLNCIGKFTSKAELKYDTLKIAIEVMPKNDTIIEMATCNCFYHLIFEISGINTIPKEILINGETLKENQINNSDIEVIE